MKFGGTSVANFEAITRAIFIVGGRLDKKPVVVVSALSRSQIFFTEYRMQQQPGIHQKPET